MIWQKSKPLLFCTLGVFAVMLILIDNRYLNTVKWPRLAPATYGNDIEQARSTEGKVLRLRQSSATTETLVNKTLLHSSVNTQATTETTHFIPSDSFTPRTSTTNSTPEWVQIFHIPKAPFRRVKTPIVFYSYYRSSLFSKCLESLALSAKDIDESTPCIFVLYRTNVGTETNVSDTLQAIERVNFCKTFVWQVNKNEPPAVLSAARYKLLWWKTTRMIFEREGIFSTILKDWNGEETVVLEEDLILSPDFVKSYWFASRISRTVDSHDLFISGVALGGWAGENIINTHPDTFVVRRSLHFQAMAYSVSSRLYGFLQANERFWVNDSIADFTESIAALHRRKNLPVLIVVPTLGRMWHIGAWGMGLSGKGAARAVETKAPWADVKHDIDLEKAVVNPGVRDLFGFLCKFNGTEYTCLNSWRKKRKMNMFGLLCVKQRHVLDRCLVPETKIDSF